MIWTKRFWKGLGERAVKTFCQVFPATLIVGVGADAIGTTAGLTDVSWGHAASVAALATIFSAVTSVGSASFTAGTDLTDADGYTDPGVDEAPEDALGDHEPTHRADG